MANSLTVRFTDDALASIKPKLEQLRGVEFNGQIATFTEEGLARTSVRDGVLEIQTQPHSPMHIISVTPRGYLWCDEEVAVKEYAR